MQSKSAYFKAMARSALRGKWQKTAWIVFIGTLISGGIQLNAGEIRPNFQLNMGMLDPSVMQMLLILVCVCLFLALMVGAVVNVGMYNLGSRILEGDEPRMKQLFPRGLVWRAVLMNILRALVVYAVMLVVIAIAAVLRSVEVLSYGLSIAYVPAFFLSYCYAMADYLLLTQPQIGPIRVLKQSRMRMRGFKSELFWLELSFIGWSLLAMLPQLVIMTLLIDISTQAAIVAGFAVGIVCNAFVSVYQIVAKTAFFRDLDNPDDGYAARRQAQQAAAQRAAQYAAPNDAQGEPQPQSEPEPQPVVPDEEEARSLFMEYRCSRNAMRDAGELEAYLAMNVDSSMELRWMRDYGDQLIHRFDRDAETLEHILRFCAEYAHEELFDRALMRIDRHIRQRTLPAADILGMIGRCLAMVKSGVYDENPGYIQRKLTQLSELIERMAQGDPDQPMIETLRNML